MKHLHIFHLCYFLHYLTLSVYIFGGIVTQYCYDYYQQKILWNLSNQTADCQNSVIIGNRGSISILTAAGVLSIQNGESSSMFIATLLPIIYVVIKLSAILQLISRFSDKQFNSSFQRKAFGIDHNASSHNNDNMTPSTSLLTTPSIISTIARSSGTWESGKTDA